MKKDVGKKQSLIIIVVSFKISNPDSIVTSELLENHPNDLFEFKIESAFEIWNRDSRRNEDVSDTIHEVTTRQPSRVIYDCGKN